MVTRDGDNRGGDAVTVPDHNTPRPKLGAGVGFGQAHPLYLAGGLTPLPLPARQKKSPPTGYTGWEGQWPTDEDYARWAVPHYDGNLAIRMPESVEVDGELWAGLGIDEDHYEGKTGAAAMAEGERRYGPLPPTYYSTSRDDGSRIRFYRIPTGLRFGGKLAFPELGIGDVELIQYGHRYAVAAPSIHDKTGRLYQWFDADGNLMDEPPAFADWPPLPAAWVEGLPRKDAPRNNSHPAGEKGRTEGGVINVTAAMTEGEPSQKVALRLARALHELNQGLSRHDTVCGHVLALLRLGRDGESGVELALVTLYRAFVDTVGPDRPGGEPEAADEFLRMCTGAETVLAAEPPRPRLEWPGPRPTFTAPEGREQDTSQDAEDHPRGAGAGRPPTDAERSAEAAFWEQRPVLAHVHRFARSRRANPYAVLGTVLRRAITLVPPTVQLPPSVGTATSVNLLTVNVGRSGQGKDVANGVGRDAVVFSKEAGEVLEDPPSPGIGTGEGVARFFRGYGADGDNAQDRAHLEVNEVGTLEALADRKGQTLVGELLKAFMARRSGSPTPRGRRPPTSPRRPTGCAWASGRSPRTPSSSSTARRTGSRSGSCGCPSSTRTRRRHRTTTRNPWPPAW